MGARCADGRVRGFSRRSGANSGVPRPAACPAARVAVRAAVRAAARVAVRVAVRVAAQPRRGGPRADRLALTESDGQTRVRLALCANTETLDHTGSRGALATAECSRSRSSSRSCSLGRSMASKPTEHAEPCGTALSTASWRSCGAVVGATTTAKACAELTSSEHSSRSRWPESMGLINRTPGGLQHLVQLGGASIARKVLPRNERARRSDSRGRRCTRGGVGGGFRGVRAACP
jgi:hypothetical protein